MESAGLPYPTVDSQVDKRTGVNVTPERKQEIKESQARRRQRLTEAAQLAGFKTIDKLADAILSGQVAIVKNQ